MEFEQFNSDVIKPERAMEILKRNGIIVTPEEAEKILEFMYFLSNLSLDQFIDLTQKSRF